ncbi:MAG: YebC/PmpR family DNA-binding transcriptional regulator [Planctomycetia bacterium]
MAGHSHAKNVKMRKGAVDAARSRLFSKMSRLIQAAARMGGGDIKGNAKLAFAVSKAKSVSLPKDTIEKAIKKGAGELGSGDNIEEIVYEGYGPNGVAVVCELLTDNRNRTASEIRKIFDVAGGNLGTTGCVGWMFKRKGQFLIEAAGRSEDSLMELALEAGAEDVKLNGDFFEILCEPTDFQAVLHALQAANIETKQADVAQIPETLVPCDEETGRKIIRMLDKLDDHDDVQNVFSNADIPDACYEES